MEHAPSDRDGLVIPTAVPSAAWSAVVGLQAVAGSARVAGSRLGAAPSVAGAWRGDAATGFAGRRVELSRRLTDVATVAERSAEVIRAWAADAEAAIASMRVARDRIEAAGAGPETGRLTPTVTTPMAGADTLAAWRAWDEAKYAYWRSVDECGAHLARLRDGLTDRPRDALDHLYGFLGATVGSVGQDVADLWRLTGQGLLDPAQWWQDVSALPGQAWGGLTAVVDHPADAGRQALGVDLWQQNRYGELAGLAVTLGLPSGRRLRLGAPDAGVTRFAARMADPDAPPPRLQTVDDMLAGVDLAAHEHHDYGHAIRRHVGADDEYLADRLLHGTLEDDGTRGYRPMSVSTFPDLPTANRLVTLALQARAGDVRDFASGVERERRLTLPLEDPVGKVLRRTPTGISSQPGREVVVVLVRGPDGSPFVRSAFLNP